MKIRIGQGYDIHRLVRDRPLLIGGVTIPFSKGEDGHSDGDVLLHAIIDALFGSLCLGDIGTHFPPGDIAYKNIDSKILLKKTYESVKNKGYEIINIDSTIILEKPKLLPYIESIRNSIARELSISIDDISVKAKTNEKQDSCGNGNSIIAHAVVLLQNKN